jgi:hypothetical protein
MFDIGSLVTISKTFLDSFVVLKGLMPSRGGPSDVALTAMRDTIDRFQTRLEGLAIQLQQSERLTRMIPAWEAYANEVTPVADINTIAETEAQRIHVALRNLIESSIRDQFSGTFFRSQFDSLPGMERELDVFRAHLGNLDRTVSTIPAGNLGAFKALWPSLSVQFNDLRNSGYQVRRLAEDINGKLIDELLDSTREARKALAKSP